MSVRARATALLDVIGYETANDATATHVATASRFAACFRGGPSVGAWNLVNLLSLATGTDPVQAPRASSTLAKLSYFPVQALAWAWADNGTKPGQLDRRPSLNGRGRHPWDQAGLTAMGSVIGWRTAPKVSRGILVLSSDTGVGKSVAATFAAVHWGGRFLRAAELGEMALGEGKALKALEHEPLLVIDELGRESDIRPTPTRIVELLGTRHEQGVATLITTQLKRFDSDNPDLSFSHRYGHHLVDRIEKGGGCWFDLQQASRRDDVQPTLDGLRRSCGIADLLPKVVSATGPKADEGVAPFVTQLQSLLGISDGAINEAIAERSNWRRPLIEQAEAIPGPFGDVVRSILLGRSSDLPADEARQP